MKTAIVYYSMSGNTQQTAEKLADRLSADLIRIDPVKEYPSTGMRKFLWGGKSAVMGEKPKLQPYPFDGGYDRIILGTPVWASNIAPPLRTFLSDHADELKGSRIAVFFCYSGGGADKAAEKLRKLLGIDAFAAQLILVDPKDKPKPEDEEKIKAFCEQLKA